MITLSYRGIEKIDEGVNRWDTIGAFLASIVWPLTWLIIGMSRFSKKIVNMIEQELKEK